MRFIIRILLIASLAATFTYALTLPHFQHIIVIVQENRTPDNLFGSNPTFLSGVDIQTPPGGQWCLGACFDPSHTNAAWQNDLQPNWCNPRYVSTAGCGSPPGNPPVTFCNGQPVGPGPGQLHMPTCPQKTYVSGTWDNSVVSPYFDIATKYGFANYFFQTNQGPSMPAHQFLFSGTSAPSGVLNQGRWNYFEAENPTPGNKGAGCTAEATVSTELINPSGIENVSVYPCFTHNSLPTLLDPAGISWRYYANKDWAIWNAPNAIYDICMPLDGQQNMCTGSDYINNDVLNPSQVLRDLGAASHQECNLKQMSWVIPNGDRSDHPGLLSGTQNHSTDIEGGPAWVADIINTLGNDPGQCGYWNNTAVFIVWDDWGGFYDHVSPFKVVNDGKSWGSGYVYGFRVPLLVVSAYTPAGYVSGKLPSPGENFPYIHDFGSILGFIENNFLGSGKIGQINPGYQFADAFAPDFKVQPLNIPLADFFPLTWARTFQAITLSTGAPDANYFLNYNGAILDPDNDVIDND
jgi:phospholipase C